MSRPISTQDRVQQYFRVKAKQLAASAELSVCEHSGLIGSHRESIQRILLREVIPARFSVGRGMVYSAMGMRSKEADIVIWDSQNYPALPMSDHSLYFVESVRLVMECKSSWSSDEWEDVLKKSADVKRLISTCPLSIRDELDSIRQDLYSLRNGIEHDGAVVWPFHVGTAALFLNGGDTLCPESLDTTELDRIDDEWPDVVLLLKPGRVIVKRYEGTGGFGGSGWLDLFDIGEDALAMFVVAFHSLLNERSAQIQEPLYLAQYCFPLNAQPTPTHSIPFPLHGPPPHRSALWRE